MTSRWLIRPRVGVAQVAFVWIVVCSLKGRRRWGGAALVEKDSKQSLTRPDVFGAVSAKKTKKKGGKSAATKNMASGGRGYADVHIGNRAWL